MALFVVGLLIWNVSTRFQQPERRVSFSEFMSWVDAGSVAKVEIVGQDINDVTKAQRDLSHVRPNAVRRPRQQADDAARCR